LLAYIKRILSYAGPIPNNNASWIPANQAAAVAAGNQRENILSICLAFSNDMTTDNACMLTAAYAKHIHLLTFLRRRKVSTNHKQNFK
jgi:hypothetical protein